MTHHDPSIESPALPALPYNELAPVIDHLHRLVQVAGKYTLDQTFEPSWGNIVFNVTGRGLSTPTLRVAGVTFTAHYRLLDGDVVLEANTGTRRVMIRPGAVRDFYRDFVAAAAELDIPAPRSAVVAEIAGARPLDVDDEVRPWDQECARLIWTGFEVAASALERWQAPYRGHRPRVGVMWGGFDLSATRYRNTPMRPPADRPVFMQRGMTEEVVALGFSFGSPGSPAAGIYAYISPQPAEIEGFDWQVPGAMWIAKEGLAILPWEELRTAARPQEAVIAFGDAVYQAAVSLGGWPAALADHRMAGWDASRTPPN